jgi:DNA ligase (NAD+)
MQEYIRNQIYYLRKEILRHNNLYYDKNNPEISDSEYDNLVRKLEYLEKMNPVFSSSDSPTQMVSGFVSSSFKYIRHSFPMFSLDNTYSKKEIERWYVKIQKNLNNKNIEFAIEPKIDGLSASLTYINGALTLGATRGNGEVGEDITKNVMMIDNIPHNLGVCNPPNFFELRGEVYINKIDFEKLNKEMFESNKQKFVNPRNAASGSLRQKDPRITAKRKLNFFVHSLGKISEDRFQNQLEFLQYCKNCGFQLQDDFKICHSLKEIESFMDFMASKRDILIYEIDGLVIKVNKLQFHRELGYTNKSPRWAVAFKFPPKQASTILNKICMQVGRTGIITPLAILNPVVVAGVTISRVTLHNFDEIKRLKINEGDTVLIERAGEVIPKVVKVIKKGTLAIKNIFFIPPNICPSCNSKIIREDKKVAYRCINPDCPAQFKRHLLHFVSRNAMNIEGFGESVIDQLISIKKIQTLADIYYLSYDDFISLNLFKVKKAVKLGKAIEVSKERPLSKLLFALGIHHIGEKISEIIAKKFRNMNALFSASIKDFTEIYEIGNILASSLKNFFANKNVFYLINSLIKAGVNMIEPELVHVDNKFKNKVFVLTGELKNYTRKYATKIIKELGGKIAVSVNKEINYIIVGTNAGLKLKKAKELNIEILNETEFEKLINNN